MIGNDSITSFIPLFRGKTKFTLKALFIYNEKHSSKKGKLIAVILNARFSHHEYKGHFHSN